MARKFRPFEFYAIPFTYTNAARARGLPVSTVRWRMRKMGLTLDEALALPPRSGKMAARARALGLKPNTIKARMRKKKLTADQALSWTWKAPRGPNTITQRARAAGLVISTVHRRVLNGMTLDEAVAKPVDWRRQPKSKRLRQIDGVTLSRPVPANANDTAATERDNHAPVAPPEMAA